MNKNIKKALLLFGATIAFGVAEKAYAAPLISGGNAVTSSSTSYYGYTEPYATVSYNSLDTKGNRILLGYGKADKNGYFNFPLSHRLRTGVYSWVYLTSNQVWNSGTELNGRVISTGSSQPSDFSAYERVIDGGQFFDPNDLANMKNRSYLGSNAQFLRNKSTKPLLEQSKLPKKVTIPTANQTITNQIKSRSKESYPYGNLFTYNSAGNLNQATKNGLTTETVWQWNPITTSGGVTNKKNIAFTSKLRFPQANINVSWQGSTYSFLSQQGVQIDKNGNIYVAYDNDTSLTNTGSFVMRISAAYAYYLSQTSGDTIVDGKKTPVWLSKSQVEAALDSGNISLSKILPSVHGATMSVIGSDVYVLTTKDFNSQSLTKLAFDYAQGVGPQSTGTTAKYKDTAQRTTLVNSDLGSSIFYKNDGVTLASGVSQNPKNLTMVDNSTGYFTIPYSKSNGQQKGWYGYAFYQLKLVSGKLEITQVPLIIQDMLGDSGNGYDPVQSITYNPNDGRMYITSNDVWASFDLSKYIITANNLQDKYEKISYATGPDENANPVEKQIGNIDIGLTSTKLNATAETEQIAFFGNTTYLMVNTNNQLMIGN